MLDIKLKILKLKTPGIDPSLSAGPAAQTA
jgi:hypothetical protein